MAIMESSSIDQIMETADKPRRQWFVEALVAVSILVPILMFVDFVSLDMEVQRNSDATGYAVRWFVVAVVIALLGVMIFLRKSRQQRWLTVGIIGLFFFAVYLFLLMAMIGPAITEIFENIPLAPLGGYN